MKKEVGIAELKAHLSEYVRAASKGKEIVIKDRDTPIAKLTPMTQRKPPFRVLPAKWRMTSTNQMVGVKAPGLTREDIDQILKETRKDRLFEWATSDTSISTRR